MSRRRLILLPGLAADERMYARLTDLPVTLVTPRLLIPEKDECMESYARRHAEWLNIGENDIVGGCSFGSMVASEICRQRSPRALVLLSGALSSDELVSSSHQLHRLTRWLPFYLVRRILMSSFFLHKVFGEAELSNVMLARDMIAEAPRELLLRGSTLAAGYCSDEAISCEIFSVHGGRDCVISPPHLDKGEILSNAGHGMVVSHAEEVAMFLRKVCSGVDLLDSGQLAIFDC